MISVVIIKESKLKIQRETCVQISIFVYEISTILSGGHLNKGCLCPVILTEPSSLDHELCQHSDMFHDTCHGNTHTHSF